MRKFFTFFAAALMSVGMFGATVQENKSLDASAWWGWNSTQANVESKLEGTITGAYGAIGTSFENANWSGWNKLVVVVDNIEGCVGEYWYLKAELRDNSFDPNASENVTMSGELGIEGHDPHETNYVVIEFASVPEGFDITNVSQLVLQSAATGSFTVSRIFLEKGTAQDPVTEDITLDASAWWGWDSSHKNVDGKLLGTVTDTWGAIATNLDNADWSEWSKLVVVVDNIEGCEGQYWYLKAEIRNPGYEYPTSVTMSGELGIEGHDPHETNYVVIDLTAVPDGFDITNVDALVLQSAVTGSFTVSRIFLEKPAPAEDVNITPNVDPDHAGVYYSTFFDSANKYALPEGVEAYVADLSGANLLLTKIANAGQTIPANVAVILKSTVTPFTLTVSDADAVTFTATNDLQGTDVSIATPDNCYVLAGEDGVGFYHYTASMLNPHKAYVIYSGSNQAPKRMPFVFNQATGVDQVPSDQVQSTKILENGVLYIIKNGVKYNAQGQVIK